MGTVEERLLKASSSPSPMDLPTLATFQTSILQDSGLSNKGFVVAGEAPESDDESKLPSPESEQPTPEQLDLDTPLRVSLPASPSRAIYNSLLHQKLWECNVSLRATIEGLLRHTTDISVEKLSVADKTLLNVQESMRATISNMTLARARLKQIHAGLEKANCSAALPTVRPS